MAWRTNLACLIKAGGRVARGWLVACQSLACNREWFSSAPCPVVQRRAVAELRDVRVPQSRARPLLWPRVHARAPLSGPGCGRRSQTRSSSLTLCRAGRMTLHCLIKLSIAQCRLCKNTALLAILGTMQNKINRPYHFVNITSPACRSQSFMLPKLACNSLCS